MSMPLAPTTQGTLRISICVCTFKRERDLHRLLESLGKLQQPADTELEVVVADNDPAGSARSLIDGLAPAFRWPLHYALESRSGVSHARNCAVRSARGEWIAFVDDDEWVEPIWLTALVTQLRAGNCEAVFGPVVPQFESDPPQWAVMNGVFRRPRRPSGTRIDWRSCGAGNVLLPRNLFDQVNGFNEAFARSGGEDSEFFSRCELAGARLVWCDEALVHETVPTARLRKAWVRERSLRSGRSYVRIVARRRGKLAAIEAGLRGVVGLLGHGMLAALFYIAGRADAFQCECRAWQGLGKCTAFLGRSSGPYAQARAGR